MTAKRAEPVPKTVDLDRVADALANAVAMGDMVNLRLLFAPFSPARQKSCEDLDTEKYAYLLPKDEIRSSERFSSALKEVKKPEVWAHIEHELGHNRAPQLPAGLVVMLGDNAVREGKFSMAAQAYEVLRIRRRMQSEFFDAGDAALAHDAVAPAVTAYLIATGLAYDYAAFPEPLPKVPNHQTSALMLHGQYPTRPEDCICLLDEESHTNAALNFLLDDADAMGRLQAISLEKRITFLKELIARQDPCWHDFSLRYREACSETEVLGERLLRQSEEGENGSESLADEIEEQLAEDPRAISAGLLGRRIENGEWWQYLKELACTHPAAILFVARQIIGEHEVLIPRLRSGSALPEALGLMREGGAGHNGESKVVTTEV